MGCEFVFSCIHFLDTQNRHNQKLLSYQQPDGSGAVSPLYSSRKTAASDNTGAPRSKIGAKSEVGAFKQEYVAFLLTYKTLF